MTDVTGGQITGTSFLLLDLGTTTIRTALVELVEGDYRLVALTQAARTANISLLQAIGQAVGRISSMTGRALLDTSGTPLLPERGYQGVDAWLITASFGEPLNVVVAGLSNEYSIYHTRRALQGSYVQVLKTLALDDSRIWRSLEDRLAEVYRQYAPEVILLVGGLPVKGEVPQTPNGLGQWAKALARLYENNGGGAAPRLIFAGHAGALKGIEETLAACGKPLICGNVLEDAANLQACLDQEYIHQKIMPTTGLRALRAWSQQDIWPTARGFGTIVRFLSQQNDMHVLGVDAGSTGTTLVLSTPDSTIRYQRTDLGTGRHSPQVLTEAGADAVARWLPGSPGGSAGAVAELLSQQEFIGRPMDAALAREAIRLTAEGIWGNSIHPHVALPHLDLIVGTGGALSQAGHFGESALVLLDSLQPRGVVNLALDPDGLMPMLGALAAHNPLAAEQVLTRDTLLNLGPVVAPIGQGKLGEQVLRLKVRPEKGAEETYEINYGSLTLIPLASDEMATLELYPAHGFDVGLGSKGKAAITQVTGGVLGLIIDARGRPIDTSRDLTSLMRQWRAALGVLTLETVA
ncbi:MAG: glutamate mutase L [Chloroflexi bacterium]|nr:glutamate mutase L [Chloroflexota bacterium]